MWSLRRVRTRSLVAIVALASLGLAPILFSAPTPSGAVATSTPARCFTLEPGAVLCITPDHLYYEKSLTDPIFRSVTLVAGSLAGR